MRLYIYEKTTKNFIDYYTVNNKEDIKKVFPLFDESLHLLSEKPIEAPLKETKQNEIIPKTIEEQLKEGSITIDYIKNSIKNKVNQKANKEILERYAEWKQINIIRNKERDYSSYEIMSNFIDTIRAYSDDEVLSLEKLTTQELIEKYKQG